MAKVKNITELQEMIESGIIIRTKHPTEPLWLLNYQHCQVWNESTLESRGLIVDSDWNIIERPFQKFFNYEELPDRSIIPAEESWVITEKLDGSLGILYWVDDTPFITTKGSWISDQGKHATEILQNRYSWSGLRRDWTYLFEIIYPENQVVVNYGDLDDIILIGVIDTETGQDIPIEHWPGEFKKVRVYTEVSDWTKAREEIDGDNREGFVLCFESGFRLKLKYESYFKKHWLQTGLSRKKILEHLISGKSRAEILGEEQDFECLTQASKTIESLFTIYHNLENEARGLVDRVKSDSPKEAASVFQGPLKGVCFKMWRNQDYRESLWKSVKGYVYRLND